MKNFLTLCFTKPIVKRAILTALLVGALLIAINHGDAILRGEMNTERWLKAGLTFLVPYLVSTVSSASTLLSVQKKKG
jgi:hypothetical protein